MPFGKLPNDLGQIDEEAVHDEAMTQVRLQFNQILWDRAQDLTRPDIANAPYEFVEMGHRPLIGAWMMEQWRPQIQWLATNARTAPLKNYCAVVASGAVEIHSESQAIPG